MKKTADVRGSVVTKFAGYARIDRRDGQSAQVATLAGPAENVMPQAAVGLVPRQKGRSAPEHFTEMPGTRGDQLRPLLDAEQRDDADVLREVLRALTLDTLVPLTVDAQVLGGVVTLTGTVSRPGDREDAQLVVACVPGVLGITDHMTLIPEGDGGDVEAEIGAALGRTEIDAGELTVEIPCDGTVVLSGAVSCRADYDRAVAAVWSVPGVIGVDDCIVVDC